VRMKTIGVLGATALTASGLVGCMTFDTRSNPGYEGPPLYSGTRVAVANFRGAFLAVRPELMAFFLADSVLSGVADTLLLPITIGEQSTWTAARVRAARTDVEQPSVIQPAAREDAVRTAKRLYRTCNGLGRTFSDRFTDCYAVGAKIEILVDGQVERTLSGAEYKDEIRAALATKRGTTEYVRLENPTYAAEGANVRVKAKRLDSEFDDQTEVEMLMGPDAEGNWRILEERSVGWR